VGTAPDPEPGNPPPTKAMEFAWLATKGTAWVVRRSTDLVPSLLAMAFAEWRFDERAEPEPLPRLNLDVDFAEAADPVALPAA
jgi:hypothetical protein